MLTKKRTVIYSLLAATLLTTSVGHAERFGSRNSNYNQPSYNYYNGGYIRNYNSLNQYTRVNNYPIFNWEVVNNQEPIIPTTPTSPDIPSTPTTKPSVPSTPAPTPSQPETSLPSVSGLSAIELEVVRLVNIERQREGLSPFIASSELSNVARKKSEDMARNNYFSHTSPTYGSPFDMMKSFGIKYSTAGENIAKGQLSAQSVVNGWMNSSGHRANIMNSSFNKIGVGYFKSNNGTNLWTQMFTN